MSEWWTYSLSDLILFSRAAYFRLFELYNAAIWPAQIAVFALGVVILERSLRGGTRASRGRGIAALLAAGWLWVAIAFHAARYATLNTAAPVFAWIFAIEAALLLWIGVVRGRLLFGRPETAWEWCGFVLFVFALAVFPFVALLCGRGLRAAEIFGLSSRPDGRRDPGAPSHVEVPAALAPHDHSDNLVRRDRRHPLRVEDTGLLDRAARGGDRRGRRRRGPLTRARLMSCAHTRAPDVVRLHARA